MLRSVAYRSYWKLRAATHYALTPFWVLRALAIKAYWRIRATGFRVYWRVRALIHYLRMAYWTMRSLMFKLYWRVRATGFRVFWAARSAALKIFWRLRALGYHCYWRIRCVPYALKHAFRGLFYKYVFRFRWAKSLRAKLRSINSALFKVKTSLILGLKGRQFQLVPMSEFVTRYGSDHTTIAQGGTVELNGPKFIGEYEFTPIGESRVVLESPSLDVVTLNDAAVVGGTNFTFMESLAIHPDAYQPDRDVCPAEMHGIAKIDLRSRVMSMCLDKEREIERAVSLLGSCTGNYAHWLTETLPKLLIVDDVPGLEEYPLLVDAWIHPRFVESITLFGRNQRELIRVPRWNRVCVKSLIEVTPTAYVPPEHRHFFETNRLDSPRAQDFTFSLTAMEMLRARATNTVRPVQGKYEKKLYLFRSRESCGNSRHVTNIDEIERMIAEYGYAMLDPAKLSFEEQVLAFSAAEKIISPLGAALANTIFAPPGCKVVGLSPYYENANYYYFSNFMGALGHEMYYVLGRQHNRGGHLLHKDYEVDLNVFTQALEFLETV